MFEGSNRYFDQTRCLGLEITEADIDALCKAMKAQAVKNAHSDEQRAMVKDVGRQQLLSWGVIIEREGKVYPSNAYAILTGCGALPWRRSAEFSKGLPRKSLWSTRGIRRDRSGSRSRKPINLFCGTFIWALFFKASIARMSMRFHQMRFGS